VPKAKYPFKRWKHAVLLRPRQVAKVGYDVDMGTILRDWAREAEVPRPHKPPVTWDEKQALARHIWHDSSIFADLRKEFLKLQVKVAGDWHKLLGDVPSPCEYDPTLDMNDMWCMSPALTEFGVEMVIKAAREKVKRQLKDGAERKLFIEPCAECWVGPELTVVSMKKVVTGIYRSGGYTRGPRLDPDGEVDPPELRIKGSHNLLEVSRVGLYVNNTIWVLAEDCVTAEQAKDMEKVAEVLMEEDVNAKRL